MRKKKIKNETQNLDKKYMSDEDKKFIRAMVQGIKESEEESKRKKELFNKYKINENDLNKFLDSLRNDDTAAEDKIKQEELNVDYQISELKKPLRLSRRNYINKKNQIIAISLILLIIIWLVIFVNNFTVIFGVILTIAIMLLAVYLIYKEKIQYQESDAKSEKDINKMKKKLKNTVNSLESEKQKKYEEFYKWRCRNYNKDMEELLKLCLGGWIKAVDEKDIITRCMYPSEVYNNYFKEHIA